MRRQNNIFFLILILAFIANSCIKSYVPKIKTNNINKYVVMGRVDKNSSVQTVNISLTSSVSEPEYIPITGCTVSISDDANHAFYLSDQGNGSYKGWVDPNYMVPGARFKVVISNTPDGDVLESDYDTLSNVSQLDSVYYKLSEKEGIQAGMATQGIQFYVDMKGNSSDSHYYKWNLYETWEYHTQYPIEWYYDGNFHHVYPPDSSKMVCWHTLKIPDIYTLNTSALTQNAYKKFPINFVDNTTSRLNYGYSLLVEQVSLSSAAYDFWERMRLNSSRTGGLYETQPLIVHGNMHDVTNPDQEVLGFFSAVSIIKKRTFVANVQGLSKYYPNYCRKMDILGRNGKILLPYDLPLYIVGDKHGYLPFAYPAECVNCLSLGGTTSKPSFWPK